MFPFLRAVTAAVSCSFVLGAAGCAGDPAPDPEAAGRAEIVEVVDGDTVTVRLVGQTTDERVRLIGIDTPESVDPRSPVECYGKEASDRTRALLPPGTAVRLERDVEARDRYDRLLAYVHRAEDDLFVNLALVEEGYASVATYPPNTAHASAFTSAAADARRTGRGLWAACSNAR
jgi:micrococcal nuclease